MTSACEKLKSISDKYYSRDFEKVARIMVRNFAGKSLFNLLNASVAHI